MFSISVVMVLLLTRAQLADSEKVREQNLHNPSISASTNMKIKFPSFTEDICLCSKPGWICENNSVAQLATTFTLPARNSSTTVPERNQRDLGGES